MNTEAQALEGQKTISNENIWEKAKVNGELIAAIVCGIFIFIGWLFDKSGASTLSIIIYILAFIIGGFARQKKALEIQLRKKSLMLKC